MTAITTPPAVTSRTPLADPVASRAAIDELLGAYGDALSAAAALPLVSRLRVEAHDPLRPDRVDAARRLVVRPVVQIEVRRHAARVLRRLAGGLDERWLECGEEDEVRQRDGLRARLRDVRATLDRRSLGRRILEQLPVVSVLGTLLVAWLFRPPADRPDAQQLYAALVGAAILLQSRAVVTMLTRPFGAQAGRALLRGGLVDLGPHGYFVRPRRAVSCVVHWPFTATKDVFVLEDRAHHVCGLSAPRRFPRDLAFTGWHLSTLGALGFVVVGLLLQEDGVVFLAFGLVGVLWSAVGTWSLVAMAAARRRAAA